MTSTVRRAGARVGFALFFAVAFAALPPVASAQGPWKVLFDGKDLSNFTIIPWAWIFSSGADDARRGGPPPASSGWRVESGVIIGGGQTPGSDALATNDKYFDFDLELDFLLGEIEGVKCSEELGPKQESLSDPACTANSGIQFRRGYQLNIGRREGGEYIGLVVHRVDPKAIRGRVFWLSYGDRAFPNLRKRRDWNALRITVKGDHHQAWLNGTKIVDVTDKSTLESEATWRQPQPLLIQMPTESSPSAAVTIKYRNIRVRTL